MSIFTVNNTLKTEYGINKLSRFESYEPSENTKPDEFKEILTCSMDCLDGSERLKTLYVILYIQLDGRAFWEIGTADDVLYESQIDLSHNTPLADVRTALRTLRSYLVSVACRGQIAA